MNDFEYKGFPVTFWDVFGQQGHPVRTLCPKWDLFYCQDYTDLNETQGGILNVVFKWLIDGDATHRPKTKAMLKYVADNSKEIT